MAEMLLGDQLDELWSMIDQQHLLYLISEGSPGKKEQREKLENFIRDYLYLAPHSRKFTFSQTAKVLHRSASNQKNFNSEKAASAWKAIGKYADNLVVQPWRKEFKDLKLYCGFYKHEIEENLTGAELMFEAMGYCHAGNSTMTITDILDPDRITSVSKDAIVAYVECQILKQIWDSLFHYDFTWLDILEFRENHIGTPDQAIRTLRFKQRQRQYEEQMCRRALNQAMESQLRPDYTYGSNIGYFDHMHCPSHSYTYPVQPSYTPITIPHIVSPGSICPQPFHSSYPPPQAIKPHDIPPMNGYHIHSHYSHQPLQDTYPTHPGYHRLHPQQSSVPTGQLIELDSTPIHNSEPPARYSEGDLASPWEDRDRNESNFPSGKAKDDGAGSWESWDYVYRNLESHGGKGNAGSSREAPPGQKGANRSGARDPDKNQGEITEKMRKINIGSTSSSKEPPTNARTSRNSSESEEDTKTKRNTGRDQVPERRESPESSGKRASVTATTGDRISQRKENLSEGERGKESEEETEEKWECISCTYLNSDDTQVCAMCYKSKEPGGESRPQPTGGQECRKCTLVNEPGLDFCVACDKSLKDSPTYI